MTTRTFNIAPDTKNIANVFDYLGLLLGLSRIPGETNAVYRRRLWDVYVRRAGAHERGLVNGITRELGLEQYEAITIDYVGYTISTPRIIVRDVQIEFYSNWSLIDETVNPNVLEATIDTFSKDSSAYYIDGLISEINNTASFVASAASSIEANTLSATIINNDSCKWQEDELVQLFKRSKLTYDSIIPGTIRLSDAEIFATQVATEEAVVADGEFYVDYTNGYLISYNTPRPNTRCRYMYNSLPLVLDASPVIVHEFGSPFFRSKMFEQILQADGSYVDGLPYSEAVDYINELLQAEKMLWGS